MSRPPKLSDAAIADIKTWAEQWRAIPSREEIAARHGVSGPTVTRIANGITRRRQPSLTDAELNSLAAEVSRETHKSHPNAPGGA